MLDLPRRRFDMAPNRKRDPRSDEAPVAICNEGDARSAADAFDALYRPHKDFVLRVALRFAPDVDTALDVLQDTFVDRPADPGRENPMNAHRRHLFPHPELPGLRPRPGSEPACTSPVSASGGCGLRARC